MRPPGVCLSPARRVPMFRLKVQGCKCTVLFDDRLLSLLPDALAWRQRLLFDYQPRHITDSLHVFKRSGGIV